VDGSWACLVVALGVLPIGCGTDITPQITEAEPDAAGAPSEPPSAETPPIPGRGVPLLAPPPLGWSLRDNTPAGQTRAAAVIDESRDRVVVLGGTSSEVWGMSLAGDPVWERITPEGDTPPAAPTAAVYDGDADRILFAVLPGAGFYEGDPASRVELWELNLGDAPHFRRLDPGGAPLASGSFNVFADGKRLFAVGGKREHEGLWQLSANGVERWDLVAELGPLDYYSARVALDEPRHRLVVFGERQVRALSLDTQSWSDLAVDLCSGNYFFRSSLLDEANERVIFLGGECADTSVFSFANDKWMWTESLAEERTFGATVVDAKRKRLLALFPSGLAQHPGNAIWQAPLNEPTLSPWTYDTRGAALDSSATVIWDPEREALVAFGGTNNTTLSHPLAPAAVWEDLKLEQTVRNGGAGGYYDPDNRAIVAFGGNVADLPVVRLSSKPGVGWETLGPTPSPDSRADYVGVYDTNAKRFVVTGGVRDPLYTDRATVMTDTWALSLAGEPVWNQLETSGAGPGARVKQVGGYDPVGRRLIAYGGRNYAGTQRYDDLHTLSLGDEAPVWSTLEAEGQHPAFAENLSAVYDPDGKRLLFVSLPNVAALELSDTPTWHTFCDSAHAPTPIVTSEVSTALVPDGLFVNAGSASYRFDLATPYCD